MQKTNRYDGCEGGIITKTFYNESEGNLFVSSEFLMCVKIVIGRIVVRYGSIVFF